MSNATPPPGDSGWSGGHGEAPDAAGAAGAAPNELYALLAPDLDAWERAVRAAEPSLPDPEVPDRALRHALAHFRQEAGQQTLAYLRWRAEQAKADAQAAVAASVAARQARAATRAGAAADPAARLARPLGRGTGGAELARVARDAEARARGHGGRRAAGRGG